MATLTREQGARIMRALEQHAGDAERALLSQSYAWGSGEPDSSIGAIEEIKKTSLRALRNTLDITIAGEKDPQRWLELAKESERAIQAVGGYANEVTIQNEVLTVGKETATDTAHIAAEGVGLAASGIGLGLGALFAGLPWLAPALITIGIVLLVILFLYIRSKLT